MSTEPAHEDFGGQIPGDWQWVDGHPFPPQWTVREVPRPRHAWNDIMACDQCERAWLITNRGQADTKEKTP